MNVEKELEKIKNRQDKRQRRTKTLKKIEEAILERKQRTQSIRNAFYSINKEIRYARQVDKLAVLIRQKIQMDYLDSLTREYKPLLNYPIIIEFSRVFNPEYMDFFRFGKYGTEGFAYKQTKKLGKILKAIRKLGYVMDEDFLNTLHDTIQTNHADVFSVSDIQYEYVEIGATSKMAPYLILSIKGPHPRKTL